MAESHNVPHVNCTCPACNPELWAAGIKGVARPGTADVESLERRLERMRTDLKMLAQEFIEGDNIEMARAALIAADSVALFKNTCETYGMDMELPFERAEAKSPDSGVVDHG